MSNLGHVALLASYATVPDAPIIGTATATGQSTASITFTAPVRNGGREIISYTAVSTPSSITATVTQSGSGTINITGLNASVTYTFVVYATNAIGNSQNSQSSNSTTTSSNFYVDYLIVGGGGGGYGATNQSGQPGAGAGGFVEVLTAPLSLDTQYYLAVGGGGTGGYSSTNATSGTRSEFAGVIAYGGGRPFTAGGSGGGGAGSGSQGAAGTAGQGNSGGAGSVGASYVSGGGGGGAGTSGQAATGGTTPKGGNGGTGRQSQITGNWYAGGGGGTSASGLGTGGLGGGGPGRSGNTGTLGGSSAGTPNTGGGAGSKRYGGGGNGGSGIVILRIPAQFSASFSNSSINISPVIDAGIKIYTFTTAGSGGFVTFTA